MGFRGAAQCAVQQSGLIKTFMDFKMPDGLPDGGFRTLQLGLPDVRPPKVPGQVKMISFFTLSQAMHCWLGASSVKPGTGARSSLKVKIGSQSQVSS